VAPLASQDLLWQRSVLGKLTEPLAGPDLASEISGSLLRRFGTLPGLLYASEEALQRAVGRHDYAASLICASKNAFEISSRISFAGPSSIRAMNVYTSIWSAGLAGAVPRR